MTRIAIRVGGVELAARLRDTPTAEAVLAALPIESEARTWGDEVYFDAPVDAVLEDDARDVVEKGEIAYWVEGGAIAIGYGPTPVSRGNEIRLVTAVNVWADAEGDPAALRDAAPGAPVSVRVAKE